MRVVLDDNREVPFVLVQDHPQCLTELRRVLGQLS